MKLDTLDGMVVFLAVAEAKNFRVAGERLGVSASAVSQALRKLEQRLSVPLVHRTTRSVSLSEAGERLYASVRPALGEVEAAVASVGELGSTLRGTLRLLLGSDIDPAFSKLLAGFLTSFPDVKLDLVVSDAILDVVARGFDAGVQLGEVIDADMVAVPVTGDIRMTVVGAPSYFARHGKPRHPRDLLEHECLNWHRTPEEMSYRWEFTEPGAGGTARGGREIAVAVTGRVLSTDSTLNLGLARAGLGLTMVYESMVREEIARGELIPVLEKFCEPFAGYYLFYPERRQASAPLRALIEHLRAARSSGRKAKRSPRKLTVTGGSPFTGEARR